SCAAHSVYFSRHHQSSSVVTSLLLAFFFFFNDTATTEIYTLSLHDALPISPRLRRPLLVYGLVELCIGGAALMMPRGFQAVAGADRKSTRLNSSHVAISYAVFCLKKKKKHRSMQLSKPSDGS